MKGLYRAALLAAAALLNVGAGPTWLGTVAQTQGGGHRLGNPAAKVKLTSFESYTCVHCAHFEQEAAPALKLAYVQPGKVSYEVRHFVRDPIDLTAAMLTECVAPAKFFNAHRAVFGAYDKWSQVLGATTKAQRDRWMVPDHGASRRAIASDLGFYELFQPLGLSRAQADHCLNDEKLAKRLAEQTKADDQKYNIAGTPSFAIDGELLLETHSWDLLRPQIDARL